MSEMDEKKKGPEKKDQESEESDLEAVRGFVQRHVWATLGSVFVVTFLLAVAITLVCVNKEQVYQNGVAAGQSMIAKYEAQGASSAEPQISESSSAGAADLKPVGATVYWTPNGSSYHSTQNCPSLSRSKNIESGTVTQAINSGHGNPCSRCH